MGGFWLVEGGFLVWFGWVVCLLTSSHDVLRSEKSDVSGNVDVADSQAFGGCEAVDAGWDRRVKTEGLIDATVEVLRTSNIFFLPLALCQRIEFLSELLHTFGVLGEMVEHVCEGRSGGIAACHDDQTGVRL